ncbi:hypothetical protein TREPR_0995 [Treponema primitia ZAS-2]|uniref:Curli production assembly/transport component CsgG n=1 Tax=Treponema primitia (strain ATCC BAA-887 / DSM 12427 / ZAS-2) TaxID=545694 RepID=F5YHS8_TREPZ|nr:CsgG/HfaB family protein [Treponema primitia]AEF86307.1 hypothetical protein TREPR_0995 [Treponema primitia ZAS-2]
MKKLSLLCILLFCGFLAYAQQAMILDDAILDAVDFFVSDLPSGSTIVVTNFEAENKELSDFIIQELLVAFSNTKRVKVVERSRLELLQSELNFNMSGSVSDETVQGIGRMMGAQILFSGSIGQYRDMYRMRVQAIVIETAEVIGIRTINIKYDPTLTGLLGRINPADAWKYQWLYTGFGLGYAEPFVQPEGVDFFSDLHMAFSLYAQFQPVDIFGIALGIYGDTYVGPVFSVLPTLTIRPSAFEIDLFFGAGIPLIRFENVVFMVGLRGGYKVGPGTMYTELLANGGPREYQDNHGKTHGTGFGVLNISLGYQMGFGQRKK